MNEMNLGVYRSIDTIKLTQLDLLYLEWVGEEDL